MQSKTTNEVAILVECAGMADIQEIVVPLGSKLRVLVEEAGKRCGISAEEVLVFREDGEEPLDLEVHIDEKYPHHKIHHTHNRKTIEVVVFFMNEKREKKFHPAAKVERVLDWAVKEYNIDPPIRPLMELALHGSKDALPNDAPIGRYVKPHQRVLELDLIRGIIPNG